MMISLHLSPSPRVFAWNMQEISEGKLKHQCDSDWVLVGLSV